MRGLGSRLKRLLKGKRPITESDSRSPGPFAKVRFLLLLNQLRNEIKNPNMKIASVLSVVRHILTFAGGYLVTKGIVDEGTLNELIGGIITVGGIVWGILEKKGR